MIVSTVVVVNLLLLNHAVQNSLQTVIQINNEHNKNIVNKDPSTQSRSVIQDDHQPVQKNAFHNKTTQTSKSIPATTTELMTPTRMMMSTPLPISSTHSTISTTVATTTSKPLPTTTTEWMPTDTHSNNSLLTKLFHDFPKEGPKSPEFRTIYKTCAKNAKWGSSVTPIDHLKSYRYLHEAEHLCIGEIDLLIAIHTNPMQTERRHLIRTTWGSLRHINNQRIVIAFFAGGGLHSSIQDTIDRESHKYGDVIQRDFTDNYRNLTLKHLSILDWILEHCQHAKYLLKVDDDTFVDPFHVLQFVSHHPPNSFICRTILGVPIRTQDSLSAKWYVTQEEYPESLYPLYCEGFAYLLDVQQVKKLYWCSVFTRFFWVDDVFVSGILADRVGLQREMFWKGHSFDWMRPAHASDVMLDYMFLSVLENVIFERTYQDIWLRILQRQTSFI